MKYHHALSSALIGVSIVIVQPQVTNAALSSEQVGEIAQGITVLIKQTDKNENGSGVIIQKQGNTFVRQASLVGINLGITVPPLQVAQVPTAEESYLKGVVNTQKGDYQGAVFQFTQAIKKNPNYAEAYYNRGNARLVLENDREAIKDFEQAIKINPEYVDAYLSKANAHRKLSQKARNMLAKAEEISHETQAMLAEQEVFQLQMRNIKNDHATRQKFITELRQRATDAKNSFN